MDPKTAEQARRAEQCSAQSDAAGARELLPEFAWSVELDVPADVAGEVLAEQAPEHVDALERAQDEDALAAMDAEQVLALLRVVLAIWHRHTRRR